MLIILGGLPGTGKTTIARELARKIGATHIRVDTIERELVRIGIPHAELDDKGYRIAMRVAEDNLCLAQTVIADTVNPVEESRIAWRAVAVRARAAFKEIEIVCSDVALHRARVEARQTDIEGLKLPSWEDVLARKYEPWRGAHVVDTAGREPAPCVAEMQSLLRRP